MLGFLRHRGRRRGSAVGVAFAADGAVAAHVVRGGRDRAPRLGACDWLPASDGEGLRRSMADWVARNGVGGADGVGVLAGGEYQVLQIEAPPVPAAEVRRAAAWRVRDLIDFPVEQAVIDVFDPPDTARRGQPNVNVVVAHRATVADRIGQLEDAGIALGVIDIPELAQRNASTFLPESRGGHALLALGDADGLVTVFRDGEQFLARTLDTGRSALAVDPDGAAQALVLEVQRSFDYFESALSQPPLGALYVYPDDTAVSGLVSALESNLLNVEARAFALGDLMEVDREPDASGALALHAVGAALRVAGGGA